MGLPKIFQFQKTLWLLRKITANAHKDPLRVSGNLLRALSETQCRYPSKICGELSKQPGFALRIVKNSL